MALHKVPGSKNYFADPAGFKEILRGPKAGAACLSVAQLVAGNAGAVGQSTYSASGATVAAGWGNEARAGAVVREVSASALDARDSILLRVVHSMSTPATGAKDTVKYTRADGSTRTATRAQAANWGRGW